MLWRIDIEVQGNLQNKDSRRLIRRLRENDGGWQWNQKEIDRFKSYKRAKTDRTRADWLLMMKKWKNKYDSDFHLVQLVDGGDIYKSKEYIRIEHMSQERIMSSVLRLRVSRTFK